MQAALLLIFLIIISIIVFIYANNIKDGFFDLHSDFKDDRQKQYSNVGISLLTADTVGTLGSSANNLLTTTPINNTNNTPLSSSVNPNSIFAITKTCEAIKTMDCNAFDDPKFSLNCGICLDGLNAKNSLGEAVPGGGLVLLAEDKLNATDKNRSNFMPTYTATVGFCPAGKLVSTKAECLKLQAQLLCQKNKSFDLPGCAQCYTSGDYSIVDPTTITGHGSISIVGSGTLNIQEQGFDSVNNIQLSDTTPYVINLRINEGGTVTFTLFPATTGASVYIAGFLSGPTFGGEFTTDLRKLIMADSVSGRKPRSSGTITVSSNPVTKMSPVFGQTILPNQPVMSLVASIPFSFVDTTSEESSLCRDGPYSTKLNTSTQDPCYANGAGPGNFTLDCLQNIWLSNGCTQSGSAYPGNASKASSLMTNLDGTLRSSNDIADYIYNKALITSTGIDENGVKQSLTAWSAASVFCTGVTIASPCEGPTKTSGPLSADCLVYLWQNAGANNPLGPTYSGYGTSLSGTGIQYCQATGTLSPIDANGNIKGAVVAWWQTKGGVDAVKKIMSDTYAAANAQSSTDAERLPYFNQCYGSLIPAARPAAVPVVYTCPPGSTAITNSPFTCKQNSVITNNFRFTSNFILTAYVTPKGPVGDWASLIHFTSGPNWGTFGSRALAIWFYNGSTTALALHIDHSTQPGWAARDNDQRGLIVPFIIGKTSKLEIICNGPDITITVDGQRAGSFTHDGMRYSGPVTVYGSNPWEYAANCSVEKLCYQSLP